MQSFRWLYNKVAGPSLVLTTLEGAIPSDTQKHPTNTQLPMSYQDITVAAPAETTHHNPKFSFPVESNVQHYHQDSSVYEQPTTPLNSEAKQRASPHGFDSGYYSYSSRPSFLRLPCSARDETPSKPSKHWKHATNKNATEHAQGKGMDTDAGRERHANLVCWSDHATDQKRGLLGRERHDSVFDALPQSVYLKIIEKEGSSTSSSSDTTSEADTSEASSESDLNQAFAAGPLPRLLGLNVQNIYDNTTSQHETILLPCTRVTNTRRKIVRPPPRTNRPKFFDLSTATLPLPSRDDINAVFEDSASDLYWRSGDGIDTPRLLQQVPCLQCVLKQLPCDKSIPHCARCQRSGHGPCLVQRQLLAEERWTVGLWAESEETGYTVLVRCKSDDQEAWTVKKALEERMLSYLQGQLERANWVLPRSGVNGGGFVKNRNLTELGRNKMLEVDFARGDGVGSE